MWWWTVVCLPHPSCSASSCRPASFPISPWVMMMMNMMMILMLLMMLMMLLMPTSIFLWNTGPPMYSFQSRETRRQPSWSWNTRIQNKNHSKLVALRCRPKLQFQIQVKAIYNYSHVLWQKWKFLKVMRQRRFCRRESYYLLLHTTTLHCTKEILLKMAKLQKYSKSLECLLADYFIFIIIFKNIVFLKHPVFVGTAYRQITTLWSFKPVRIEVISKKPWKSKTKSAPENPGRRGFAPHSGRGYARAAPEYGDGGGCGVATPYSLVIQSCWLTKNLLWGFEVQ